MGAAALEANGASIDGAIPSSEYEGQRYCHHSVQSVQLERAAYHRECDE